MRKIADVRCDFTKNLHYKPWNIFWSSKYLANGLSESKISNGSDVRFVRDSHLKIRCFVNFDAILRKICIINLEIFFDHQNIWPMDYQNPKSQIDRMYGLPVTAIWKTPKIGDFRRDFTKNLHIKSSNFFSPLKSWHIFLPESEISCTSYERFGFYSPNKIVTFHVSEFNFFEKREKSAIFDAILRKIGM